MERYLVRPECGPIGWRPSLNPSSLRLERGQVAPPVPLRRRADLTSRPGHGGALSAASSGSLVVDTRLTHGPYLLRDSASPGRTSVSCRKP